MGVSKPPRTPTELAAEYDRKTYSFSLNKATAERLKAVAAKANVPVSTLVDEAIKAYLEATKGR